jgi:hypothetical protein
MMVKMMNRLNLKLLMITALLGCYFAPSFVAAQEFNQLSGDVQQVLRNFEGNWDGIENDRKTQMVAGAERWLQLDTGARDAARERFTEWQQLAPETRTRVTEQVRQFRSLSDTQRQQIRRAFENYQSLNTEQRRRLRALYQDLSAQQRRQLRQLLQDRQNR